MDSPTLFFLILQGMYNLGARNFVLLSTEVSGCTPFGRSSNAGMCNEEYNYASTTFNTRVNASIDELNQEMADAHFIFVSLYRMITEIIEDPSAYGFENITAPCCEVPDGATTCEEDGAVCPDRSKYLYFDGGHPTDAANIILASRAYYSNQTTIAYPFNVKQLMNVTSLRDDSRKATKPWSMVTNFKDVHRELTQIEQEMGWCQGRLSLIKHALLLLPSYWILVVKLPATTCNQLNKMAPEFLWGDMAYHKSIHRIKWSTTCLPHLEGCVGRRDIKETNLANMAYLVYRASQQTSPWADLIKCRYCERQGLLDNKIRGKRVSHVWRRALQSWRKVNKNIGWKIGNGVLAKFWTDHWGADRLMDMIPSSHIHLIHDTITCSVKELLEENGEALMDFLAKLNIHFTCPPLQADQPDAMV
ncbi:putative ribonuclease H protein [Nymphaea thermarum]|nr:putative ribonuclease H protein [Nymphaea thermarum]